MGLVKVLSNCEASMLSLLDAKMKRYHDSSAINISEEPRLYNCMVVLMFDSPVSPTLQRQIVEDAFIYSARSRVHHVIGLEFDRGLVTINNTVVWRCSAGNQRIDEHPHIRNILLELAEQHLNSPEPMAIA